MVFRSHRRPETGCVITSGWVGFSGLRTAALPPGPDPRSQKCNRWVEPIEQFQNHSTLPNYVYWSVVRQWKSLEMKGESRTAAVLIAPLVVILTPLVDVVDRHVVAVLRPRHRVVFLRRDDLLVHRGVVTHAHAQAALPEVGRQQLEGSVAADEARVAAGLRSGDAVHGAEHRRALQLPDPVSVPHVALGGKGGELLVRDTVVVRDAAVALNHDARVMVEPGDGLDRMAFVQVGRLMVEQRGEGNLVRGRERLVAWEV